MPARPLLSAATAALVRGLPLRGLATAISLTNPDGDEMGIWRLDAVTGQWAVVMRDLFHLRGSGYEPGDGGDAAMRVATTTGNIRRAVPPVGWLRLHPGDRFTLPGTGQSAVIQSVAPDRYGIEEASWVLEQGAA